MQRLNRLYRYFFSKKLRVWKTRPIDTRLIMDDVSVEPYFLRELFAADD